MSRMSCAIAAFVLAVTLAGCGGTTPDQTEHFEFKGTTSPEIEGLRDNMSKSLKGNLHLKKIKEPDKKAADAKASEKPQ